MDRPVSPRTYASSTRAQPSAAPSPSPSSAPPPQVIYVFYGSRQVKARIDREVPLHEILRQLVASTQLSVEDQDAEYALREKETSELITDDNYTRHLELGHAFNLCLSPRLEATQMVEKLLSFEPPILKLATFSLRTLIKERVFLTEFLRHGGLDALQEVIKRTSGNTLAYSLLCMQSLMDLEDRGWEGLEDGFVSRIVEIIATEPLINISRPATALLRRLSLVCPPISFADSISIDSSLSRPPTPPERPSSGFAAVYKEIEQQPGFLGIVVGRLSSGDVQVVDLSLGLINSLFRGATEIGDQRFGDELEALDGWKAIAKLFDARKTGDLLPILTFQSQLVASLHQQLNTSITEAEYGLFDAVWEASGLDEGDDSYRWRRLGFLSENPQYEFQETGVLGLKALARFAGEETNEFASALKETHSRPSDRRCPIAHASSLALTLLAQHFSLDSGLSSAPTMPNPYLLRFYECHALVIQFFIRIWGESGAASGDVDRVRKLTRSQIKVVLGSGGEKSWFKIRQGFLHADYKTIRDRQMQEMAVEDDLLSKAPVRHLRGRLYLESYEFVRSQRISCLQEGAWFRVPAPAGFGSKREKQQVKLWRFYRLAANRKLLHYVEKAERGPIRPGLDDLPERIDLALVTDVVPVSSPASTADPKSPTKRSFSIASGASLPFDPRHSRHQRSHSQTSVSTATAPATAAPISAEATLTFSLLSADGTLASLQAPNADVYSEWIDGLSLLRTDGNICTRETADYVHALTEIGVKIKLLDLSGEGVEIPTGLTVQGVPAISDFVYSDSM